MRLSDFVVLNIYLITLHVRIFFWTICCNKYYVSKIIYCGGKSGVFGFFKAERAMTQVLNRNVLVLNKHWMAIHVCSVKRAVTLLYQDLARVVTDDYEVIDFNSWRDMSRFADGDVIHTPSYPLLVPEVILLRRCNKLPKHYVKFNRRNIYQRDNFTCQYCGSLLPRYELTIDHVIPRSRGGRSTWANVVLACIQCNAIKGDQLTSECSMHLIRKPREPHWSMLMYRPLLEEEHTLWRKFIDVAYWNVTLEE